MVYIADTYNNQVLKETPSSGGYTQSTVAGSLSRRFGVAMDGGPTHVRQLSLHGADVRLPDCRQRWQLYLSGWPTARQGIARPTGAGAA